MTEKFGKNEKKTRKILEKDCKYQLNKRDEKKMRELREDAEN